MKSEEAAFFKRVQDGKEEGKTKSKEEIADDTATVEALLAITDWLDERIANYANVSVSFVEKVKSTSNYRMSRTMFISNRLIREEAVLERNILFVSNLLRYTGFPIDKIASLAGVSIPFVKEVKADLRM